MIKTVILDANDLEIAAAFLKDGKIVAFPTETVFGMGVIYDNAQSLSILKKVKGRDEAKPFTLIITDITEIKSYAEVNNAIMALATKYMPGPLTLILPAKPALIGPITNNLPFIGIRISSASIVNQLIKLVGKPLLVPSANKSTMPPLFNSEDVFNVFDGEISAVVSGVATGSKASTVIKISDKIELVREGEIPFNELKKIYEEAKK